MPMSNLLTNLVLRTNKYSYSIQVPSQNIRHFSLFASVNWQHLFVKIICKKYLLNQDYQCLEDKYLITIE